MSVGFKLRLMLKLAALPLRRSWLLLTLMVVSFAQLMLLLWFAASIYLEIQRTDHYAQTAKFVSLQVKDDAFLKSDLESKLEEWGVQVSRLSMEELKTDEVLAKMETEEPEVVQTVRALGPDGLQLVSRVFLLRGELTDQALEQLKLMPVFSRVEVSPIHHARLKSFYGHLGKELKAGFVLFLFLVLVQLLVFQRVQLRDLSEVERNLLAWGASYSQAKLPGAFSLFLLSVTAMVLSSLEWWILSQNVWKGNAFLGELSLDRQLHFPWWWVMILMACILGMSVVLSFSGRGSEE
jgi:hypothetical protein